MTQTKGLFFPFGWGFHRGFSASETFVFYRELLLAKLNKRWETWTKTKEDDGEDDFLRSVKSVFHLMIF